MCDVDSQDREWRSFITDMIVFCEKVLRYTGDLNFERFVDDELIYDATMRNVRLIGEAALNIPPAVQAANQTIDWRQIIGMRHRLTHAYKAVSDDVVWDTIQSDIPQLLSQLREMQERIDRDKL